MYIYTHIYINVQQGRNIEITYIKIKLVKILCKIYNLMNEIVAFVRHLYIYL